MANASLEQKVYTTNCSEFEENVKSRAAIVQSYTSSRAREGELSLLHALPFCCLVKHNYTYIYLILDEENLVTKLYCSFTEKFQLII